MACETMNKCILLSLIFVILGSQVFGYDEEDLDKFLRTNQCENCDLALVDLKDMNLSKANLREADLFGAKLSRADLREAELVEVNLIEADLSQTNLINANLIGTDLWGGYSHRC